MSTQEPLNLEQLGETYEVIGELAGRQDARTYIAKRREDDVDVLIAVSQTPQGDEGNALSHLAADTNLLTGHSHRNILPILDGRWVGADAFAVVTERIYSPGLGELLARRDEAFDYPRIAAILREVNGALEWAREKKIVHRAVALDTVFVEPGTDRVFLSFIARSLPLSDMPGAEADAKMIAVLARAMLTRSTAAPERANLPLAEARPGLPAKVVEQTDALLQLSRTSELVPDISAYIAAIAMADALKEGEVNVEKAGLVIDEQQRLHREQLEAERSAHDQQLTAEKKAHELDVAEQAKRFQKEREEFEHQLAKERQALTKEREALVKERAEHAKDCAALVAERAAHERDVAEMRERLEWETAALATQAELNMHATEVSAPVGDAAPVVAPAPKRPEPPRPLRPLRPTRSGPAWWARAWQKRPRWTRPNWNAAWTKGAVLAGLVLLIAASAIAIGRNRASTDTAVSPRAGQGVTNTAATSVVDSVAGGIGTPLDTPPPNAASLNVPGDLITGVVSRAALSPPPAPRRARLIQQEPSAMATDTALVTRPDSAARRDTLAPRRDTLAPRRDTLARPKPDSVPQRDSTQSAQRDTHAVEAGQQDLGPAT